MMTESSLKLAMIYAARKSLLAIHCTWLTEDSFVFAYKLEMTGELGFNVPYIFRSYDHFRRRNSSPTSPYPRNPGQASTLHIWQVARAATAAPLYFAPFVIFPDGDKPQPKDFLVPPGQPVTFIGACFGDSTNPSKEAFYEVTTLKETIGTFVSIGTGTGGRSNKFSASLISRLSAGIKIVGDHETAHLDTQSLSQEHGFGYFQLNEYGGLTDLGFDEWEPRTSGRQTRQKILLAFQKWSINPTVLDMLRRCAHELVRRRRLRARDASRWERFALKAFFDCTEDNCRQPGNKRWYNRNDFQRHLVEDHKMKEGPDLQKIINKYREIWRYKPGVDVQIS
jgi:hypothetical protein